MRVNWVGLIVPALVLGVLASPGAVAAPAAGTPEQVVKGVPRAASASGRTPAEVAAILAAAPTDRVPVDPGRLAGAAAERLAPADLSRSVAPVPPARVAGRPATAPPATPNQTVGILLYDDEAGKGHRCTAVTVVSQHRVLVATAGHCVHGGKGKDFFTRFEFVPGFEKSGPTAPFGMFKGSLPATLRGWAKLSDPRYDIGFLTLLPNEHGPVGAVVGENGLAVGEPYKAPRQLFGYHQDRTFQSCFGETRAFGSPLFPLVVIDCGFLEGTSGGPWFKDYRPGSVPYGVVNGITGGYHRENPQITYSMYFNRAVWDLFQDMADET